VTGITIFGLDVSPRFFPDSVVVPLYLISYCLSVATTVLCTLLIIARIFLVTRLSKTVPKPSLKLQSGAFRRSSTVIEVIVESAALYSISALIFIPMIGPQNEKAVTYVQYAELFFADMAVSY
jgi:hypothetical protein